MSTSLAITPTSTPPLVKAKLHQIRNEIQLFLAARGESVHGLSCFFSSYAARTSAREGMINNGEAVAYINFAKASMQDGSEVTSDLFAEIVEYLQTLASEGEILPFVTRNSLLQIKVFTTSAFPEGKPPVRESRAKVKPEEQEVDLAA